jgi:VanZ family protein
LTARRVLLLAWVVATLTLATSLGSAARSGAALTPWLERWGLSAARAETAHVLARKAVHLTAYGVFALLARAVLPPGPRRRRRALLAAFALALADEGVQALFGSRGASSGDVALDVLGAALALALVRGPGRARRDGAATGASA